MRIGAVIEIAPDATGALPVDLITEAYRASRAAAIAFVLDPLVRRPAVDRVLDPVVAEDCGNVHGVLYLDQSDDQTITAAITRAEFVVAMSDGFRSRCESRGVQSVAWPAARARFSGLSERRRAFIPSFRTGADLQPVTR
jgi:hypothetical protein